MLDYTIMGMRRTEEGFLVATVHSNRDQQDYEVHNRWGSWIVGDVNRSGGREAAVIALSLAAALQNYASRGKGIEAAPKKENVFIKKAKQADNPFIKKAAKTNPLIAKLQAKGKA
jgi:hypothetical protein